MGYTWIIHGFGIDNVALYISKIEVCKINHTN